MSLSLCSKSHLGFSAKGLANWNYIFCFPSHKCSSTTGGKHQGAQWGRAFHCLCPTDRFHRKHHDSKCPSIPSTVRCLASSGHGSVLSGVVCPVNRSTGAALQRVKGTSHSPSVYEQRFGCRLTAGTVWAGVGMASVVRTPLLEPLPHGTETLCQIGDAHGY